MKTGGVQTALAIAMVFFFSLATGLLPQLNSNVEGELFLKQSVNKAFIDLWAPRAGGDHTEWSSEGASALGAADARYIAGVADGIVDVPTVKYLPCTGAKLI